MRILGRPFSRYSQAAPDTPEPNPLSVSAVHAYPPEAGYSGDVVFAAPLDPAHSEDISNENVILTALPSKQVLAPVAVTRQQFTTNQLTFAYAGSLPIDAKNFQLCFKTIHFTTTGAVNMVCGLGGASRTFHVRFARSGT